MAKSRKAAPGDAKRRSSPARKPVPAPGVRKAVQAVQTAPAPPPPIRLPKTYLSKAELEAYRQQLLQKRRTLLGDLSGMAEHTAGQQASGNLSTMPTHMADVGTDNFEHEFTLGLLESEQALLREINDALKRIDERLYGICLGTGQQIPKARLNAKPWAKYTVEYARLLEKGLVRPPDASSQRSAEGDEEEPQEDAPAAEEEEEALPEEDREREE